MKNFTQYPCPFRVAIAGYFLFTLSTLMLAWVLVLRFFPVRGRMPLRFPVALSELAYAAVAAICAFYIFKGANWSRFLFIGLAVIHIARRVMVGGHGWLMLMGAVLAYLTVMLLTPCAHRYFTGRDPFRTRPKPAPLPPRRPHEGKYEY